MVVTIAIGLGAAVSLTRLCTNLDIYRIQYVKYDILDQFVMLLVVNSVALMVVIIAAMRKLLHIIYGVLKTKTYFNPDIEIIISKNEKLLKNS